MKTFLLSLLLAPWLSLLVAAGAVADDYPAKPITLIIPFQGGVTEQLGRAYADELSKVLDTPVIVEVKPGAGGAIGSKYAANAASDGYTLVVAGDGMAIKAALTPGDSFDPQRDLEPIGPLMSQPFLLVVRPDSEFKTLSDIIHYASQHPRKVTYASVGPGTAAHLMGQFLMSETHTQLVHVPYKGGGAQALAVMSGEVNFGFLTAAFVQPYLDAGTLRAIALIDQQRSPLFPTVPTASEAGYPALTPAGTTWFALFAPAGIPTAAKQRLTRAVTEIERRGTIAGLIKKWGGQPLTGGPEAVQQKLGNSITQWRALLANSGEKKQ
ncbi:tripartite tricarboxylate transporter substrate binding protein [Erwiniaceae bacterium BAC15a-03b]|uniref:Tripartite tricarboxylate transporter substrate binding protein n=1 Tax=Winslowiella arboricola TaxID=2978220 RepID=A0A9J6PYD1_9GAMM|nr:tripartite tricarboxylate transporter substrate binding protein [Winslowiella arboricola]MCU5772493.1 tripartite tricarboxylate transporter substrate binding protein [Winslowiella arboricola]MCU5779015.1 tripartite tricarboxylate transporter substrate binding protein [Winslowiella arboricola]